MRKKIRKICVIMIAAVMAAAVNAPGAFAVTRLHTGNDANAVFASVTVSSDENKELQIIEKESLEILNKVGSKSKKSNKKCTVKIKIDNGINYYIRKKYNGSGKKVAAKSKNTYSLTKGLYCLMIDEGGYYKTKQPFYVSASDVKKKSKNVNAEPQVMSGKGNEPAGWVFRWTKQVLNKFYGTNGLNGYTAFDTPSFDSDKAAHEFLSSDERLKYLEKAVDSSDDLSMYYIDKNTPVIFYSNDSAEAKAMSDAGSLEGAAAVMNESNNLKICYQAQVHGNEPAGGEAAMYAVEMLAENPDTYLGIGKNENIGVDVYIIPCINPEGAATFTREGSDGIDMNRDGLQLTSSKMRSVHELYVSIMPEVTIDAHESASQRIVTAAGVISNLDDVRIRGTDNTNSALSVRNWSMTLTQKAIKKLKSTGLRPFYYYPTVNSTASRGFYGMYDSVSLIVESVGLGEGKEHYGRRVYSQYVSIKSLIDNAINNSEAIKSGVASARVKTASNGEHYSSTNVFVLKHIQGKTIKMLRPSMRITGTYYNKNKKGSSFVWKKSKITRAMPTAYIIPKNAKNADKVMSTLTSNGVKSYEAEPGTVIQVNRYAGTRTKAKLGAKKATTFSKGAYIIPMSQVGAKVAADSLEPDVYDNNRENKQQTLSYWMNITDLYRYTGKLSLLEEYKIQSDETADDVEISGDGSENSESDSQVSLPSGNESESISGSGIESSAEDYETESQDQNLSD